LRCANDLVGRPWRRKNETSALPDPGLLEHLCLCRVTVDGVNFLAAELLDRLVVEFDDGWLKPAFDQDIGDDVPHWSVPDHEVAMLLGRWPRWQNRRISPWSEPFEQPSSWVHELVQERIDRD